MGKESWVHSSSYCAYYFAAETRLRGGMPSHDEFAEVTGWLEKAVAMNPQFAPAYAARASAFSTRPETYQKAFEAGKKSRCNWNPAT
jgi:soluble lytic murein transglycosylase-like protein